MVKDIAVELGVSSARVVELNRTSLEHLRVLVETGRHAALPDQKKQRGMASCCPDKFHYSRGLCENCYRKERHRNKERAA